MTADTPMPTPDADGPVASELIEDRVRAWTLAAAQAADDRKAEDIAVIEVGAVTAVADWFVIATGTNPRHVKAIAEAVEAAVKDVDDGPSPRAVEGRGDGDWQLIDYGDIVVHVFGIEARKYYDLERLWSDCPRLEWEPVAPPA